jgi:glycolate oxidase iron-sulfur subunit
MHTTPASWLEGTRQGKQARELLSRCVHCGFCLPACPTYRLLGNELDSPRGRIYLIKQLVEGEQQTDMIGKHLDRCLTCRACEAACPSGVQYGRLVDLGRELLESADRRGTGERVTRWLLTETLSRRRLVSGGIGLARALGPLLPAALRSRIPPPARSPASSAADASQARRVVLLEGCVQSGLRPGINAAATRVLGTLGIGVMQAEREQCCGALCHHLGRHDRALGQVRSNIESFAEALDRGAEAIVSTTSACGLMVKEYAMLLQNDQRWSAPAQRISAATRDVSELIDAEGLARAGLGSRPRARVALQSPCTLQHGQRLTGRVERLLQAAGFTLAPVANPTDCCGSAGTYSILQPEISNALRERKLEALMAGEPQVIATANIGCLEHLRPVAPVPVRHWIELLADAIEDSAPPSAPG